MTRQRGKHAIVVGAGVGGLLFARVLADSFEQVTVLERDALADNLEPRSGVPQGRHLHALLAGGCQAMESLLPGLVNDFEAGGAAKLTVGLSARIERPGYDPFPRRDLGLYSYSMSRPLLELCVRRRVQALPNITLTPETAVERLMHEGDAVTGVMLRDGRVLGGDLVVDASGRGELTFRAFDEMGLARPRATTIGVDVNYASALFEIPEDFDRDWVNLMIFPKVPESSKGVLLATIEGNRWLCGIAWRGEGEVPEDRDSVIEWTRRHPRTQTAYNALKNAKMIGKVMRFLFPESIHRHFSQLDSLPAGLLPVADVICRLNPNHGQGMSVAALEAAAFGELLASADDMRALIPAFLKRTDQIIEGPWNIAALPDFAFPDTRGERPAELMNALRFGEAFSALAARDAGAHKLMMEIQTLCKPQSAVMAEPALMQRIQQIMIEMIQAEAAAVAS